MRALSGHELTTSADCKIAGCMNEAASTRGMYAYLCTEHIAEAKRDKASGARPGAAGDSTAAKLRQLGKLATAVDKATAKRRKAQSTYEAAVDDEENAQYAYRAALREALGDGAES